MSILKLYCLHKILKTLLDFHIFCVHIIYSSNQFLFNKLAVIKLYQHNFYLTMLYQALYLVSFNYLHVNIFVNNSIFNEIFWAIRRTSGEYRYVRDCMACCCHWQLLNVEHTRSGSSLRCCNVKCLKCKPLIIFFTFPFIRARVTRLWATSRAWSGVF